jgi:maltose/moltooligosaccharide transporter
MEKPALSLRQIGNLSFGFFGIQFGWGLQMANMSAIYEHLGAKADQIPILWLAAPLTGLLVQPVIGHMSDRTWNRLGRRRPYFLAGAILSSLGLLAMPHATALWMAAVMLWLLDASINISMEPFRAFVADVLPPRQRAQGFAMQSLFIGLGAVIASALPFILTNYFHIGGGEQARGTIPLSVRLSFEMGAVVFLGAVLWTIFTSKEYPPEQDDVVPHGGGLLSQAQELLAAIVAMPVTMRRLAAVQISTWLGLFCMWLYFPVAVAHNVFGAAGEASALYRDGTEWAGICFAMYSAVCFLYSFLLPGLAAKFGRKMTHILSLLCGAAGLVSVAFIHSKYPLLASMTGIGIAWASILAMPYAILAGALPATKMGTYMGVFNFSIVLPEIIASLGFGWVMNHWLNNNRLTAVVSGGAFLILAALLMARVHDETAPEALSAEESAAEGALGAAGA